MNSYPDIHAALLNEPNGFVILEREQAGWRIYAEASDRETARGHWTPGRRIYFWRGTQHGWQFQTMPEQTMAFLENFTGTTCLCGKLKGHKKSFCTGCYNRLPHHMQLRLYRKFRDGYEAAFVAACDTLGHREPEGRETRADREDRVLMLRRAKEQGTLTEKGAGVLEKLEGHQDHG